MGMVSYLKGKRAKEGASDARSPPRARPTPSGPSSPTITKLSSMSRRVITSAGASLLAGAGMGGSAAAAAKKVGPDVALFVRLVEARDLVAADFGGTSDPYCVLLVDGKERWRSGTVKKTLNPKYNERFSLTLPVHSAYPKELRFCFYDYDGIGKDDFLGQVVVPGAGILDVSTPSVGSDTIPQIPEEGPPEKWLPLTKRKKSDKVKGEASLAMWIGKKADFKSAGTDVVTHVQPGLRYVKVKVIAARGLIAADKCGTSDPYVVTRLGTQKAMTKSKRRDLNPTWNETFLFVCEEELAGQCLTLDVLDWDESGNDDPLGSVAFDLGDVQIQPREDHANLAVPMQSFWFPLKFHKERKPCKGELCLAVQVQEGYRVSNADKPVLGKLVVNLCQGRDLASTNNMDMPDPYAVIKFEETWMRTKTYKDTLYPQFDCRVELDVHEVSEVLSVAIMDDNHQEQKNLTERVLALTASRDTPMGKVVVPISCLVQNQVYRHNFPMFQRRNHKLKSVGELEMEICFKVTGHAVMSCSIPILLTYKNPVMPPKYYYDPPTEKDTKRIRTASRQIVIGHLASRHKAPIRKETCEFVLNSGHDEFQMHRVKTRIARIRAVKSVLGPIAGLASSGLALVLSWRQPWITVLFLLAYVVMCMFLHLVIPAIFFCNFLASLVYFMNKKFDNPPTATLEMLEGLAQEQEPSDGKVDEEVDMEGASKGYNPVKALKAKIDSLKAPALTVQDMLGEVAITLERFQAILTWEDNIASFCFMMGFLMAAIMSFVIPFKYGLAMGGVGTIVGRHPRIKNPLPGAATNVFNRLPHKGYFML